VFFDIVGWFLSLALGYQVVIAFALYVVVVCGIYAMAWFFFGRQVADSVGDFVGIPGRVIYWVISLPIRIVCWPFAYRNNRIFREEFGKNPHECSDERIEERLTDLAESMQTAFDVQELARLEYQAKRIKVSLLEEANANALYCKERFWQVHALAQSRGFHVRKSYSSYLSYEYTVARSEHHKARERAKMSKALTRYAPSSRDDDVI